MAGVQMDAQQVVPPDCWHLATPGPNSRVWLTRPVTLALDRADGSTATLTLAELTPATTLHTAAETGGSMLMDITAHTWAIVAVLGDSTAHTVRFSELAQLPAAAAADWAILAWIVGTEVKDWQQR